MFKNDVTDWPTSFFYREKRSALFCWRGRIEIKYLLSWLLQNNLLGVEILFEIETRLFYFKQHFDTEEVILQCCKRIETSMEMFIIYIYPIDSCTCTFVYLIASVCLSHPGYMYRCTAVASLSPPPSSCLPIYSPCEVFLLKQSSYDCWFLMYYGYVLYTTLWIETSNISGNWRFYWSFFLIDS